MKQINNFFSKGNLLYVYMFMVIFIGGWMYFLFHFADMKTLDLHRVKVVCAIFGLVFGAAATGFVYLMRQANNFWKKFHVIEDKINASEDANELNRIYYDELVPLSKTAFHPSQYPSLTQLKLVIETKLKYIK